MTWWMFWVTEDATFCMSLLLYFLHGGHLQLCSTLPTYPNTYRLWRCLEDTPSRHLNLKQKEVAAIVSVCVCVLGVGCCCCCLNLGCVLLPFLDVHHLMLKGLICLNYWCIHFIYLRACRSVSGILNLAWRPWSQTPTWLFSNDPWFDGPLPGPYLPFFEDIHPKILQTKNHLKSKSSRRGFLGRSRVFRRWHFFRSSFGSVLVVS